jgi:uncharacterized protein YndB with AHSA1/START domain
MTLVPSSGRARARVTLAADAQILITRDFDAPRHLVFRAWTTPELGKRWWPAHRGDVTSIDIDLRVGGRWRYAMMANEGFEVAFHGEYREIVPNERIVHTEVFEARPAVEALTSVTFTEADGRTTVAILVQYDNEPDRDTHYAYMQDGLQDGMDLLEQTLISVAGAASARGRDDSAPAHSPRGGL